MRPRGPTGPASVGASVQLHAARGSYVLSARATSVRSRNARIGAIPSERHVHRHLRRVELNCRTAPLSCGGIPTPSNRVTRKPFFLPICARFRRFSYQTPSCRFLTLARLLRLRASTRSLLARLTLLGMFCSFCFPDDFNAMVRVSEPAA